MRTHFIKKHLLNHRPFSICSYFKQKFSTFSFSSYMGILFKWPKIKAENTLQHFITNAHLLFILSLSSRTANSHAVHYADVYAAVTWSGKTPSLITIRIKGNVRNDPCYHKLNIRRKHNESHEYSQNNGTFNHSSGSIFSPYWCRKLI